MHAPGRKAYFFKGNQYVQYDLSKGQARGYPRPISAGSWDRVWPSGVDAALHHPNGQHVYLFKGNQYVKYHLKKKKVESGYPRQINADTWEDVWTSGVDAAVVNLSKRKYYFFKGRYYIRFDIGKDKADSGYPRPIAKDWPGLPWDRGIDAVWNNGKGKYIFFKGSQYVQYDINKDRADLGYPKTILDDWPGVWDKGRGVDVAHIRVTSKEKQLNNRGRRLVGGSSLRSAGFGGFVKTYRDESRTAIYWHPDVTGKTAYELHRGIAGAYARSGGPSNRNLGYPKSNIERTIDGAYLRARFEWGAIYGVPDHNHPSMIYGSLYRAWEKYGISTARGRAAGSHELSPLGYPVMGNTRVRGGEAVVFERGCLWSRNGSLFLAEMQLPLLGQPRVVDPQSPVDRRDLVQLHIRHQRLPGITRQSSIAQADARVLAEAFRGRLVLTPITKTRSSQVDSVPLNPTTISTREVGFSIRPQDRFRLKNRTLYNIGLRLPSNKVYPLSPHSVYVKNAWEEFGFIHATDFHVSRRIEEYRTLFRDVGQRQSIRHLSHFNDNTRDMIRYANHLHDIGMIDFVMATGDLIDFIYEADDNRHGGGNFAFFNELVLGQSPSKDPEGSTSEELRVPIFTSLGNHDYRVGRYWLYADISAAGFSGAPQSHYSNHNITQDEAKILQGGKKLEVNWRSWLESITPYSKQDQHPYYLKHISSEPSYVVKLGQHRIAMIDSKYDLGVSFSGIAKVQAGFGSEDEKMLVEGSPNSVGFDNDHLRLLRQAKQEARTRQGLVIVGVHAPPLNPSGSEYGYYLRETAHPHLDESRQEIASYLFRRSKIAASSATAAVVSNFKDWIRSGTTHFKNGGVDDLLDWGISKGKTLEFLNLCVKKNNQQPVDLVLFGHVHKQVAFRLGWDPTRNELLYFNDFYTEVPEQYYPSYDYGLSSRDERPIHLRVRRGARLNATPVEARDARTGTMYRRLDVPPYPTPLNDAPDPKGWWEAHRPLMLQTASVGPIDKNQRIDPDDPEKPSIAFQGFRVISVQDNTISKIRHVRLADLRRNNFVMPWEVTTRTPRVIINTPIQGRAIRALRKKPSAV